MYKYTPGMLVRLTRDHESGEIHKGEIATVTNYSPPDCNGNRILALRSANNIAFFLMVNDASDDDGIEPVKTSVAGLKGD